MGAASTVLCESRGDVLALPGLIAACLAAVAVRDVFWRPHSTIILAMVAVGALLDLAVTRWALHLGRATFAVTADRITFTPRRGTGSKPPPAQTIERTPASTLSFRLHDNGIIGGQPQYLLRLRDDATGQEVAASAFGRRKVRRACESQGWAFS